jgi:hypothetical protein
VVAFHLVLYREPKEGRMMDEISKLLNKRKSYAEMDPKDYEKAVNAMLATMKYNMPLSKDNEGYPYDLSRSGINARNMAMLAMDRGVDMYPPAGPNRTYTDEQYLDTLMQQPPSNKLFTPQQDVDARANLAAQQAAFQDALRRQQRFTNPGAGPEYGMDYTQYAPVARNSMLSYLQPYLERFGLYQK